VGRTGEVGRRTLFTLEAGIMHSARPNGKANGVAAPTRDPQLRNRMNDDAATAEQAKTKVAMLMERLRGGADFGNVAMDFSEDPETVAQGGDLGFIPISVLRQSTPQLRDVVLRTAPGNVSTAMVGPAHTIVMVVSREDPGQRDLNAPVVREGIRDLIRDQRIQLLRTAHVAAAR
jgi:peptidyl-prolyl cis-trans isomerase SurA